MTLNGFDVSFLIQALRLNSAASEGALASSFRQTTQCSFWVRHQDAQHAVQIAVIKSVPGALQVAIVGKDLLGPGNIAHCPFQFDRVGSQVDGDVQTVFQHMQVFVPGTEQGFNVRSNLDALLHSALAYPSVDGYAWFAAIALRWHCCHAGAPVPAFVTTKFFSLCRWNRPECSLPRCKLLPLR